jgi:hypothetical protein
MRKNKNKNKKTDSRQREEAVLPRTIFVGKIFIKNLKEYCLPIGVIVLSGLIGLVGIYFYTKDKKVGEMAVTIPVVTEKKECETRRKIDGVCLSENEKDAGVFAVMIDNLREARPQSGLSKASLVYEAVAEGNITRFLAVFSLNETVAKIGPIRSARPYYVNWAKELSCPYLHVGGSPEALDYLSSYYKFDLNEMSRGQYFYRDPARYAPHNVFSNTESVRNAVERYQWDVKDNFDSFLFKEEVKIEERGEVKKISLDFYLSDFFVEWQFDKEKNNYQRIVGRKIQKDVLDGSEIRAKNIVVIPAKYVVLDGYGRQSLASLEVGTGTAYIFQDGNVIEGNWKKENKNARRKFFDDRDVEISFNVGQTWIEVLPQNYKLTY